MGTNVWFTSSGTVTLLGHPMADNRVGGIRHFGGP